MRALAILPLLVVCAIACTPDKAETDPAKRPLTGKPDPRFFGTWKAERGGGTYTFKEDGTYDYASVVTSQGGTFDNRFTAKWSVDGDEILVADRQGLLVGYDYTIDATTLTMTSKGSMKNQTVLKKQP